MKLLLAAAFGLTTMAAHNLDEYLQAALIGVERERVEVSLRMTPGPAVFGAFSAMLDPDGDERITNDEQAQYRRLALRDWQLSLDDKSLAIDCRESEVSPLAELREGAGAVWIRCVAELQGMPPGMHRLRFRNGHQAAWSVYMMNALQPGPGVSIQSQERDSLQREITIAFEASGPVRRAGSWWLGVMIAALLLRAAYLARSSGKA